jgi:hypothetical protein
MAIYTLPREIAFNFFCQLLFMLELKLDISTEVPTIKGDHKGSPLRLVFDHNQLI